MVTSWEYLIVQLSLYPEPDVSWSHRIGLVRLIREV